MAVGAGALPVQHGDFCGRKPECAGEPIALHGRALGVRPHGERPVLEFGERAGRPLVGGARVAADDEERTAPGKRREDLAAAEE